MNEWKRLITYITTYGTAIGFTIGITIQLIFRLGGIDGIIAVSIVAGLVGGGIYGTYLGILTQKIKFATIGLVLGLFSGAVGGSGGAIAIKSYFIVIAWIVTKIVQWTLSIGFTESATSLLGTALGGAFFGMVISLIHIVTKIALTPNEGFKSTIKQATMWIIIYTSIGIVAGLFAKPTFCGNVTDICG